MRTLPPDSTSSTLETESGRSAWHTLKSLLPYLWPAQANSIRVRVVFALICLILAKVATIYVPFFYKSAVDQLNQPSQDLIVIPLSLIMAYGGARILSLIFAELRDVIFARVGQRAIQQISQQVFIHLHQLSLRFHLSRQTGGLSRSIERGTKAVEVLLQYSLFNVLPTLFEISVVVVLMWHLFNATLALSILITVILYIAYTFAVTEWRIQFRRQMHTSDAQANTKAIESLLNYETVKYFGTEAFEAQRYNQSLQAYAHAATRSKVSLGLLNIGQAIIITTGLSIVMWLTAKGISEHDYQLGDFVLVNTLMLQLYQPLNFFGMVYREIKHALIDIERLFQLLDEKPDVADRTDACDLILNHAHVSFKNIGFHYDARRPILKDVSFDIPAGHTVAIVGPTGSGKSTLARLLFRFYDVATGSISIDQQNIQQISQHSLRRAIGIVPQDTVLFNDTIAYNIAYGCPTATLEDIHRAAQLAQIHEAIVQMPDAYQTLVGERGLKLSGGEKQRIAIARTILKDPAIFIFDEATSALDTQTEKDIQEKLLSLSKGKTTLIIAHRLSTIIHANKIIVLKAGQIIEQGTHDELLAMNGYYKKMWEKQHQKVSS